MKVLSTVSFLLFVFLWLPVSALIEEQEDGSYLVYDEQYSDEIHFDYKHTLVEPNSVGTGGWVPGCSGIMPFSMLINLYYGAEMGVEMRGRGLAKWPDAVKLYFEGTPDGGLAWMDYGIEMESKYKNCYTGDETEISKWLNFDLRFFDRRVFTPFLLDGNVDNPVSLEDSIDTFHLWDGTLDELTGGALSISLPFVGSLANLIHFSFDLDGKMYVEMFGSRLVLDEKAQRSIYADGQYILVDPPLVGSTLDIPVHYETKVYYETVLILSIDVTIKIIDITFPIDIPIPLAEGSEIWLFDSQNVKFDFPAIFIKDRMHHFANTVPGDEDNWELMVENLGERAMDVQVVSDNSVFLIVPKTIHLEPGERQAVRVTFKPYQEGDESGTISFYSNDPVEPLTRVALSGGSSESDTQWSKTQEGDKPEYTILEGDGGCSLTSVETSTHNGGLLFLALLSVFSTLFIWRRN